MANAAICYDTWHGHTAKIADRVAEQLALKGFATNTYAIRNGESPTFTKMDAVIIVAPIHTGHHSKHLRRFVLKHELGLSCVPSLFLSVGLAAAGDAAQRDDAQRIMENFLSETEWNPTGCHIVAGELAYRRYAFLTRCIMRWIAWKSGGSTDVGCNHVYTDWSQLAEFVDEFVEAIPGIGATELTHCQNPDSELAESS